MTPEIEALLGATPKSELAPPPVKEPDTPAHVRERVLRAASAGNGTFIEAGALMRPVTRAFMTEVTRLDENVVRRRLLHCPRLGKKGQRELYDFMTAIGYLVDPQIDIETFIKTMNPKKLPAGLNKDVWDGMHKRLRYQRDAGEAWHTEDVVEVLGTVFMTIKDRMQLITETMRDRAGLTDAQAARFAEMIDGLQADLHKSLVTLPEQQRTPPVVEKDVEE